VAPVGASGAREAWHAYYVMPVRSSTFPIYDLFISTASLNQLATNIQQSPRRVTAANATGLPREVPHVAATAPQWNATQPAIFVTETGVVHDVQFRHRGSFAFRSVAAKSYKLYFPGYQPYKGERTVFISSKDIKTSEGQTIFRFAGLPVSLTRSVTWYMNSDAPITRLEQGDYSGDSLDGWHKLEQALAPGSVREETGDLYKNQGNVNASQNNIEGPYTRGDLAPMLANAGWTALQRYEWTLPIQKPRLERHSPDEAARRCNVGRARRHETPRLT
jgi:hypothetical protein